MKGGAKEIQEKKDELDAELAELEKNISELKIKRERKTDELSEIQKIVDEYEEKISRLGGGYATQRHELQQKESVLKEKTANIEENIREICLDALPFTMIPKQLEELVKQINQDQEITKNQFEKQSLEENLSQVVRKLMKTNFGMTLKLILT